MMDTTSCPECGEEARVEWRAVLEGTDGPVEHCKVRCGQKHWFLLPVATLAERRATQVAEPDGGQLTVRGHPRPVALHGDQ